MAVKLPARFFFERSGPADGIVKTGPVLIQLHQLKLGIVNLFLNRVGFQQRESGSFCRGAIFAVLQVFV